MICQLTDNETTLVSGGDGAGGYDAYGGIDWSSLGVDMGYQLYQSYLVWQQNHPRLGPSDWAGGGYIP
jgi:hypothetical protein